MNAYAYNCTLNYAVSSPNVLYRVVMRQTDRRKADGITEIIIIHPPFLLHTTMPSAQSSFPLKIHDLELE